MSKTFDLSGKRAAVTGAGSGIGAAIAKALASHGAEVAVLELSRDSGEKVVGEIGEAGGRAFFVPCDVSAFDSVTAAFAKAAAGKSIDILVNNAGIAHVGNAETTSPEDFDRVYQVNVKGAFHCIKAALGSMKEKGGSIINVSSVAAHVGVSDRLAYSMSKGAIHAITLSVAKDCIGYNIRCNSIAPARVHTPFVDGFVAKNYPGKEKEMLAQLAASQPIGRMGKPDEIGSLVLYLCSDEAAFITGSSFPIDGGFMTLNS